MNGKLIHPGCEYAISEVARKGVSDLMNVPYVRQCKVLNVGVERVLPIGRTKNDGYRVVYKDLTHGVYYGGDHTFILKGRDFLMSWDEYAAKKAVRDAAKEKIEKKLRENKEALMQREDAVRQAFEMMGLRQTEWTSRYDSNSFAISGGGYIFMDINCAEALLGSISTTIYEAIRDAT